MKLAEITPISSKAINNLGGRTFRLVEVLKIDGDRALLRVKSNKFTPYKAMWYTEGVDFKIHSIN